MKTLKINKIILITMAFAVVAFAASCTAVGGDAGSCNDSTFCTDYIGADYTSDSVNDACLGTYSTEACATTNSVGSCVVDADQANETKVTYDKSGYDASSASAACDGAGGTFN